MHVCILHHSTKQQLHNHLMDLDILDMVCQKDSEDEESEGEDDSGLVESIPTSSLDVLRGRVKENLELLHSSAPIDASPLILSDLRERFPQVIYIICMFTISCQFIVTISCQFIVHYRTTVANMPPRELLSSHWQRNVFPGFITCRTFIKFAMKGIHRDLREGTG